MKPTVLCLAALLAVTGACCFPLWGETRVGGIIEKNARWTPDGSPYIISRDILVTRQSRLTIAPGTRIVVAKPSHYDTKIPQLDRTDSLTVAIKIQGMLSCIGRRNNRITVSSIRGSSSSCSWYGFVFDNSFDQLTEIAFTDIAGACNGITIRNCSPVIRNSVLEYNNVGIRCSEKGNARVYNCAIAHNFTCGIRVEAANPIFYNNIIVNNRNNGVWCDGVSRMTFKFNCLHGNPDGNLLDCDPELGVLRTAKKGKTPTDIAYNLTGNPVFAGSPDDSLAVERDLAIPTDKSRVTDTTLAKTLHGSLSDSSAAKRRSDAHPRYTLSSYSPCVDAGSPQKVFKDTDGSRNDMGIYGGPEFFEEAP